ncbi:MAG: cyclase family protein [Firmicutes bacterium]|nr:cyclase family protein [Alicyclobacillaceae bacterium]MCL6497625.1 cyclase family protein [Bacillota bacterium]
MATVEDVERLAQACCNWGRWGPEDELGTLNFVTPETVRAAKEEIRTGEVFSLAIGFGPSGPQHGRDGRFNPIHLMRATGTDVAAGYQAADSGGYADDVVIMPLQCATQWDGLGHIFHRGRMWNGYGVETIGSGGARRLAITAFRDRLVGRGVLVDVAGFRGVECLLPGEAIRAEELEAVLAAEGVRLRRGDFLLVRTGQLDFCLEHGWGDFAGGDAPGLALDTAPWLYAKEVAAVATDTWGAEVRPNEVPDMRQPWHHVVIPYIGLVVGEIWRLGPLAEAARRDGRYTCFLAAPALPIEGAVGSPVNPLAVR